MSNQAQRPGTRGITIPGVAHIPDPEPEPFAVEKIQAIEFDKSKKYLLIVKVPDIPDIDPASVGGDIQRAVRDLFDKHFPDYSVEVMVTIGGIDVSVIETK